MPGAATLANKPGNSLCPGRKNFERAFYTIKALKYFLQEKLASN